VTPAATAPRATVATRWAGTVCQRLFRHAPADDRPVTLRHHRIYILPTRRGWAFVGTLLLLLVTSLNYALSLGFAVTFLLGGLVAIALVHTFRNLAGIELRPLSAGEAFAGSPLPFSLALAGGALPRFDVHLAAPEGSVVSADITPEATLPVTLELPTRRRGVRALGRITVSSDFPLGLWRAWAYVHFPLQGVVFPAPEPAAPPLPFARAGDNDGGPLARDDAELAGLREYQPGDPMQRVAWKAVARGGGWYSKEFDGRGGGGPLALAWHALPGTLDPEQRIARLTAWVQAAEQAARPFSLTAPGVTLPVGQGREHRRRALTALALIEAPFPEGGPKGGAPGEHRRTQPDVAPARAMHREAPA
jgi:uncharacterized protein (DUF58 family)